ncbi:MAG: hypothetical protein HQM10_26025 [Candidatus Riflebacteria bacterium]|nr:hypothetical protein [Candidatus Riflebacteria bacterium]
MNKHFFKSLMCVLFSVFIATSALAAGDKIKKAEWLSPRAAAEQFAFDLKCWKSMLFPPQALTGDEAKRQDAQRQLLGRLLLVVKYGGLKMRTSSVNAEPAEDSEPQGNSSSWKEFPHLTASVFSHGGRTMIAVKKSAGLDPYTVTNWIVNGTTTGGTKQATDDKNSGSGFKGRAFSTHWTDFKSGIPVEKKCKIPNTQNWAMNIPMGGIGSEGADGKPVKPNGAFGHLLFVIDKAPAKSKDWTVGILVGVENSQAPAFTLSGNSKSHLGTSHSLTGAAEEIGPTGGKKWPAMTDIPAEWLPGKYDCMRVTIDSKAQFDAIVKKASIINDEQAMVDLLSSPPVQPK